MRSNKTKLGLSQWELDDKPDMDDFNEDNAIIEKELQSKCTTDYVNAQLLKKVDVSDSGNWARLITSLSQIDIAIGTETIPDIAIKMPKNSIMVIAIGDVNNLSEFPATTGTLRASKCDDTRVVFDFDRKPSLNNQIPRRWIAVYDSRYDYYGWLELATIKA